MSLARARLQQERKSWRKQHPFGFVAKPRMNADGTQDLLHWRFEIPTKATSIWHPLVVRGELAFSEDYPQHPPAARFDMINGSALFHPNVFPDGNVCLSIINPPGSKHAYGEGGNWSPAFGIQQVVLALQKFLDESSGFAQGSEEAYRLRRDDYDAYVRRVKDQVTRARAC